jgi:hypothetical protein
MRLEEQHAQISAALASVASQIVDVPNEGSSIANTHAANTKQTSISHPYLALPYIH